MYNINNSLLNMDMKKAIIEESGPTKRIKLRSLNPHIVCLLCAGYLVDATTIVECLHTFCKSCIVRYLQSSKLCPTCGIVIHETDPLSKIKRDSVMQDIMEKLLPGILIKEKKSEDEFVARMTKKEAEHEPRVKSACKPDVDLSYFPHFYQCGEKFNLCLQLDPKSEMMMDEMEVEEIHNKYVRCPGRAKVSHVKSVIRKSYEPHCGGYELKIHCNNDKIEDDEHMKLVYAKYWKRQQQPIMLFYGFYVVREDNYITFDDSTSNVEHHHEERLVDCSTTTLSSSFERINRSISKDSGSDAPAACGKDLNNNCIDVAMPDDIMESDNTISC